MVSNICAGVLVVIWAAYGVTWYRYQKEKKSGHVQ